MRAAVYEKFGQPLSIQNVPDPRPNAHGAVIKVMATGLCLSDWHGWMGHDPDIQLPQVPGHELAGIVEAVGKDVTRWKAGDVVTMPFVCACGSCPQCLSGNHQVCDHQFQPGFTHWGSFAEYVAIDQADINLVRLPRGTRFCHCREFGLPFCYLLQSDGCTGKSKRRPVGRGARLRGGRVVDHHDRQCFGCQRDWH